MSDNDESGIKVTDKRMFTADGTLREEYRFLEDEAKQERERGRERPPEAEAPIPEAEGPVSAPPGSEPATETAEPGPPEIDLPGQEGQGRTPGFLDLVAALAEPASVYLRNAVQSPAESSQSLEVARLYIDLLDVLRQKTDGNLTLEESDMLEDALQQLRLGYVQTKG